MPRSGPARHAGWPALAAGLVCCAAAWGQVAEPAETVVITGSLAERRLADAPYAVGVVGREALREAGPGLNLSEALGRVPGLVVANRSNYAQDLQISSRGFGARAGFGVRGVRLLADGIPASGPDGQGQVAQFDLANAQRVEVLRGPYSVLYGNSSGGVIALVSAPVRAAGGEAVLDSGSFGLRQLRAMVQAPLGEAAGGQLDLRLSVAGMQTDGFRPQSAAQRRLATARLHWADADDSLLLTAGAFSQPAQDPLGLSRAQFDADPRQTTPQALTFDTRKESMQTQAGAVWRHRFSGGGPLRELQAMAHGGQRSVTQWLAIAAATQANARHGGGVIDFDRQFAGSELRLRLVWDRLEMVTGVAVDDQRDARRGYENFTGTGAQQQLGVTGRLRRDESNRARAADAFAQAEWALADPLLLTAGVRSGQVRLQAQDRYLANGDDSGGLRFRYTNPVLGLRWQAAPGWQLHASAARGFEAPTLGEVAYRADAASGLNTALKAQRSRQWELGSKWRVRGAAGQVEADLAIFEAQVRDEIGVATNAGGRSAFQNVGRTQRRGLELAAGWAGGPWHGRLALTVLDATYRDAFLTCAGIPCTSPTVPVAAGGRIAGTQRQSLAGEVGWRHAQGGRVALELRSAGKTAVNDLNSDFAAAYTLAALRLSHPVPLGAGLKGEILLRVDNLADRVHAGTVIVNEANGRFFEPGTPRAWLLALRIQTGG